MSFVNEWGMKSGIVKVIPPPEWVAAQPRLDDAIKTVRVKEPIKQDIMGTGGTYRQANIVHQRSYNLPQWRQLCEQSEHQPPAKRGERRANQDKAVKPAPRTRTTTASSAGASKRRGAGRSARNKSRGATKEGTGTPDRLPTPVSPMMKPEDYDDNVKVEPEDEDDTQSKPRGGRQPKAISVSSRRKNNKRETGIVDEAAFKDFKYELEGEDYSPERCEELERAYWKTLTYAAPLYGADMPGTLFDERTKEWNLGKLDNILDVLGSKIPGVNTAYLYLGMWKATFAWHLEDVDLYSINYLHFGAPKQWYSISQGDARRFEAAMKSIWPTDAKACDQFLRHKTFLISPSQLMSNYNIKVNKITHHPGEFVITFPYGYHSGYNLGYNCAEAVNFGLESWLPYGRVAKKCDCSEAQDSVWIDVHEIDRKLRGEETEFEETDEEEEDEEEEEEDNVAVGLTVAPQTATVDTKPKAPKRKRKRPTTEVDNKSSTKRIRVRIKAPSKEPCILCPNDIPSEPLLPTDEGHRAHRMCAMYIPETSIEHGLQDTVVDIKYINKARLELKCNYCRSKKGACFQCSQKKCTRAFHATCAAAAGVLVEQGEIPVFGEDGTEYKDWGIEFSCRFHRTKRDKKADSDSLGDDKRIMEAAAKVKVGDVCQMQFLRGDIFAGAVVENRLDEEMLLVDILPRGYVLTHKCKLNTNTIHSDRLEVEHKWLLIPDPADFRLQKPSAKAIALPSSYKAKESLNTSKRQVDDLPRAEDPFVEGCTWAEFKCEKVLRNPAQVEVDLDKADQIWYYLGKNSTEARAQFTENPANPVHNPKGHFLDTIPKPAPAAPRHQTYAATYPSKLNPASQSKPATPIRPPVAQETKSYAYKPREENASTMYRVDPQAYLSQQNFLQQSSSASQRAPKPSLSFGTDPRFENAAPAPRPVNPQPQYQKAPAPRPVNPQPHYQSAPLPRVITPSSQFQTPPPPRVINPQPQYQSGKGPRPTSSQPQYHNSSVPRPASQSSYDSAPAPRPVSQSKPQGTPAARPLSAHNTHKTPFSNNSSRPIGQISQMAPPQKAMRPQQSTPVQPKPNNNTSKSHVRVSPFAKYAYLQKEHNRSPLEYKSPYRPGGGFMNGYQGNLQKHLQQTMFNSSSLTSLPYGNSPRSMYSSSPSSTYASSTQSSTGASYNSPSSTVSKQSSASPAAYGGQAKWEKKDSTQLHPAIRQEYKNFHQQYQPQQSQPSQQTQEFKPLQYHTSRPPSQSGSVLQPPAMYDRNSAQLQTKYSQNNSSQTQQPPQATYYQQVQPSKQQSYSPSPSVSQSSSGSQSSNGYRSDSQSRYQPSTSTKQEIHHPLTPQQYTQQHNSQQTPQQYAHQPYTPHQHYQHHPAIVTPNSSSSQSQSYAQGAVQAAGTPLYSHQQYYQNEQNHAQDPKQLPRDTRPRDFPDVPADSTSIVEQMMLNLRKARQSSSFR